MKEHTKEEIQLRIQKLAVKPLCFLRALRIRRLQRWLSGFLVIALLVLTSCKECNDPSGPPMELANYIANKWQCTNVTAVQTDVEAWFAAKHMCTASQIQQLAPPGSKQGTIANIVCPILGAALRMYAVSQVPVAWECNPGLIGVNVADALVQLCEFAPF